MSWSQVHCLVIYFRHWHLCSPVLSSIPDRVPEMDENWTFGVYSNVCAKEGLKIGFYIGRHLS
jgi:hypothetical protein